MISWLENLYVLTNLFLKSSSNFLWYFFLQHKQLYSTKSSMMLVYLRQHLQYFDLILVSHFLSWCPYLNLILWIPSARLLTRFDNELAINLTVSINCNLYNILEFFLHFHQKFELLLLLELNCHSYSFASSFIKW